MNLLCHTELKNKIKKLVLTLSFNVLLKHSKFDNYIYFEFIYYFTGPIVFFKTHFSIKI